MGGGQHLSRLTVAGVDGGDELGEMDGLQWPARLEVGPGPGEDCRGSGQFDQIGADRLRSDRVELGGGAVVEPSGVVLPDGPHVPGHPAVALTDVQMLGQSDLTHQGLDILARVHSGDGLVVYRPDRPGEPAELFVDALRPDDRVEVPGEQNLRTQRANPFDGVDNAQSVAITVTTHGDEIGNVTEDRAERVAAQTDPLLRQPDDHRVGGLSARRGDQFQASAAEGQGQRVNDGDVGGGGTLRWEFRAEPALNRRDPVG